MAGSEEKRARPHKAAARTVQEELRVILDRLSMLTDVSLRLSQSTARIAEGNTVVPVLAAGEPTGWQVVSEEDDSRAKLTAKLAADLLGSLLPEAKDVGSAVAQPPGQERRLEFLYETSREVGELLDEQKICDFVVREAAELLQCGRASIMLIDPDTNVLNIRSSLGVPHDIAEETAVRPGERISGKVFASGREVIVGEGDPMPSDSLGVRELAGSASFLSVPLTMPDEYGAEQRIVGVINLTRHVASNVFSAADIRLVQTLALHTAAQISNCRLFAAERERRRLEQELEIAAAIQLGLLPEAPLTVGRFCATGVCRPAKRIGGDFFDYWRFDDRVCLLVADVTGHDLGAALLASAFRSVVRAESAHRESLPQMISRINSALMGDLIRAEMQISLCYLEVSLDTNMLTYCRCGHPYPLLVRRGESTWLEQGGMLLGVSEDSEYPEGSLHLKQGDTVVVYTDGVIESGNRALSPFGREGLLEAVRQSSPSRVEELTQDVVSAVEQHMEGTRPQDDLTVLAATIGQPELQP